MEGITHYLFNQIFLVFKPDTDKTHIHPWRTRRIEEARGIGLFIFSPDPRRLIPTPHRKIQNVRLVWFLDTEDLSVNLRNDTTFFLVFTTSCIVLRIF